MSVYDAHGENISTLGHSIPFDGKDIVFLQNSVWNLWLSSDIYELPDEVLIVQEMYNAAFSMRQADRVLPRGSKRSPARNWRNHLGVLRRTIWSRFIRLSWNFKSWPGNVILTRRIKWKEFGLPVSFIMNGWQLLHCGVGWNSWHSRQLPKAKWEFLRDTIFQPVSFLISPPPHWRIRCVEYWLLSYWQILRRGFGWPILCRITGWVWIISNAPSLFAKKYSAHSYASFSDHQATYWQWIFNSGKHRPFVTICFHCATLTHSRDEFAFRAFVS